MTNNSNITTAEYISLKRITDPEIIRIVREREKNPSILTGKEKLYCFLKMMGIDIEMDEIFNDE